MIKLKIKRPLLLSACAIAGLTLTACSGHSSNYAQQSSYSEHSRYGEFRSEESSCAVVQQCGYWMIPTYHVITTPLRPAPEPEPPVYEPPVYVPPSCPPGTYFGSDGVTCLTPEPEPPVYVPPVIPHYPEPPMPEPPQYLPPRK